MTHIFNDTARDTNLKTKQKNDTTSKQNQNKKNHLFFVTIKNLEWLAVIKQQPLITEKSVNGSYFVVKCKFLADVIIYYFLSILFIQFVSK